MFHIWCADKQKQHPPPPVVAFFVILAPGTKLPTYLLTYLLISIYIILRFVCLRICLPVIRACVRAWFCRHDILQTACGNFNKFITQVQLGTKRNSRFWGRKVKDQDHSETTRGQIITLGYILQTSWGISPNLPLRCSWGHRRTSYILRSKVKG